MQLNNNLALVLPRLLRDLPWPGDAIPIRGAYKSPAGLVIPVLSDTPLAAANQVALTNRRIEDSLNLHPLKRDAITIGKHPAHC